MSIASYEVLNTNIVGNLRSKTFKITLKTDGTGNLNTGFSRIVNCNSQNQTSADAGKIVVDNNGTIAKNGFIALTDFSAGDVILVTVYGK